MKNTKSNGSHIQVECPTCGGSGKSTLAEHLSVVVDVLKEHGESTAAEVSGRLTGEYAARPQLVTHRLHKLSDLGIVKRRKPSKNYLFSVE